MPKCSQCQGGPLFGQNRPWSKKRTNRRFEINVQRVTVTRGGRKQQVSMCTRCMRTMVKS